MESEVRDGNSEKHVGDEHFDKDKEHDGENRTVTIFVNEQPVKLHGDTATGAQIKTVAIAQGVQIQQNFVLQEELPNGTSRIVGDNDKVHLREHLRFTALAPDDNS